MTLNGKGQMVVSSLNNVYRDSKGVLRNLNNDIVDES